jgi:hypothetical protein
VVVQVASNVRYGEHHLTDPTAMQRRSEGRLTGCARMMHDAGTPSSRTSSTSPMDAQSKPAPSAASVEMTPRSGRHFTVE